MSGGDDYVTVPVMIQAVTDKAVCVSSLNDPDVEDWLPRSCLHGGDDSWLTEQGRNAIYVERDIQIREWIAKAKGFA